MSTNRNLPRGFEYEGTKRLFAWPMTRGEYNLYRGWELPSDEDGSEDGYLVEYLDGGKANDDRHQGYISWSPKDVFDRHYHKVIEKSLGNTDSNGTKKNVPDVAFWGNGDSFKLICKAHSKSEGWMKSTKAMEIEGVGCVVQVTTQQGENVSEALTFVPGVKIVDVSANSTNGVTERRLARM